jgi:hypothetical protein
MQSKREILGEQLYEFLKSSGIDPALGFVILINIVIVHRIYCRLKDEDYSSLNKVNDAILVLATILVYYLYIF